MKYLGFLFILFLSISVSAQELPEAYVSIDENGDNIIEVKEVQNTIDGFFTQSNEYSVEFIHGLIDYFFDQP